MLPKRGAAAKLATTQAEKKVTQNVTVNVTVNSKSEGSELSDKIGQLKLPVSDENNKKTINSSEEKLVDKRSLKQKMVDILICELVTKCHELKLLATIENKKIRNFRIFFNRETSINSLIL